MADSNGEIVIEFGERVLRSSQDAADTRLEEAYDRYSSLLFRYAYALLGSSDDAEDAVQEVFVRLARDGKVLARVEHLKAYLFTSTRNAAYSILRGRKRGDEIESMLVSTESSLHTTCGFDLDSIVICEAFAALPVEQREVLVLKIFGELTFMEIAKTTHVSINTVASRYRYAIERLRRILEENDNG